MLMISTCGNIRNKACLCTFSCVRALTSFQEMRFEEDGVEMRAVVEKDKDLMKMYM